MIPLVFLPGLLCDDALWRAQADAVSDLAACTVADLTGDSSMAAMAARVLAAAPERFALAGLSMGGYVAFEVMRQRPDRVLALALFDTSAKPDTPERSEQRRAAIEQLALGKFAGITARLLPQFVHPQRVDGPVGDSVRAMTQRVGGDAFRRQQDAIMGRPDSRPLLPSIRVPTLVAVGAEDVLTPVAEAEEMHRLIPDSVLEVFPECGHLPTMECPAEASAALRRWLARIA